MSQPASKSFWSCTGYNSSARCNRALSLNEFSVLSEGGNIVCIPDTDPLARSFLCHCKGIDIAPHIQQTGAARSQIARCHRSRTCGAFAHVSSGSLLAVIPGSLSLAHPARTSFALTNPAGVFGESTCAPFPLPPTSCLRYARARLSGLGLFEEFYTQLTYFMRMLASLFPGCHRAPLQGSFRIPVGLVTIQRTISSAIASLRMRPRPLHARCRLARERSNREARDASATVIFCRALSHTGGTH
jgi:hypothetical protein